MNKKDSKFYFISQPQNIDLLKICYVFTRWKKNVIFNILEGNYYLRDLLDTNGSMMKGAINRIEIIHNISDSLVDNLSLLFFFFFLIIKPLISIF